METVLAVILLPSAFGRGHRITEADSRIAAAVFLFLTWSEAT